MFNLSRQQRWMCRMGRLAHSLTLHRIFWVSVEGFSSLIDISALCVVQGACKGYSSQTLRASETLAVAVELHYMDLCRVLLCIERRGSAGTTCEAFLFVHVATSPRAELHATSSHTWRPYNPVGAS